MYYSRSRSPASFAEGRSYNSIGKGTSYNYSTDFSLSSLNPRNPSIQRVINADYGLSEYSRSPLTDYSNPVSRLTSLRSLPTSFSGEASPTFRRRDQSSSRVLNDRSSPVSLRSEDLGYSSKSRNYFDYSSSASSLFTSYTPPIKHIKKPQRTDYTDYLRPVLTARPMLKSGYTPRSRDEREDNSIPLVRERKLIKFREISSNILSKVKRKMSWDLPEEISSPLIDENKQNSCEIGNVVSEQKRNKECNLNRRGSQDILSSTPGTSPMSGSPRPSVSRRSSDDQSLDKLSRIRRQSPMNNNSVISRESIYSSLDLKPEDLSINQYGKAPVPPPRKKSLGSNEKNKKSRKSSIEMLLSQEKSSNFSKIANEIRRNREAESSDVSTEGPLYEKRVSQDATIPTASVANTMDTRLSSTVSEPIAVNESMDTDNGRGRRQRRRTLPEHETEPSETRSRHRSRFRSQLSNEVSDQSTSIVSNKVSDVFSPNETPYPTSRMHRKSVKYKDGLLPRRRSKCPEVVPESVVDSIPTSLGTTVESKESKTEEKKKPDFNKLTKRETLPNVTASHKINTQNKMKHQEAELISDKMPKSKLEFPSDKVKISENTLNLENKMLSSAETVSNDKHTPQTKSKSKFKSPVVSSHIINERDTKTSDQLTNIKTLEIEASEQNSKYETKIVAKSGFNNITSKIGIGQTEAKPTLANIVNESEIKLIDENNSYKIGIKEEMTDKKLPQGGTLNKNKESDGKKLNKPKLNSSDSKVLLDAKSKIESKAATVPNSTTDNSTITKIKVTGTQTSKKLKINAENTSEDKLNKTSSIITEDANIKSSTADSDINVSLCKLSKIGDKVKQNMNSVTGFKTNTDDKDDAKSFHQSKLKEDNCLKDEVSKIKDTDVKGLSVNSNSDMDRSILSNKTLEPKAEKLIAVTNSAFDNSIRTEIKETDLNFCEKSKLDVKRINGEKDAKNEDSKLSTKAINVNNFSRLNSKPEIDKDSKVLHKKSKTEAKVIADTKSVIENNTKAASKGTDIKYSDILKFNKDNSVESKVSNIKKSNVENKMLLDTNSKAKSQITSDLNSTSCNNTKIKVKETDNKNLDKSELNEDDSLKCEVSKNKDSDLKNKMLLDSNSKSEIKITSTKNFNKDSTADNLLRVKPKELDSKVPTDNTTTKFPDIKQLKNSNIKIDAKKSALKETSDISMKSVEKQELEKHTEKFQPQKNTPASKVQEKVAQTKEFEEIVVVCKLPPPKLVCKLPPPEPETMNQNIPSVVVSIKNPALKTANDAASSDVEKDNLAIIPSKESFSNDKLESCDTLKKHCNAEETEVKVVHTVVLKPKIQKKYLENKNLPNSHKVEKEVGTQDKLKAIPDVIKSTIRIDSKSDSEISDIVKGTLNKEDGQVNANKMISDARNDSLDENCGKSLTNRKMSLAKELSDLNKQLVTKEKSKVESQSPNESKNILNNSNEVAAKDVERENVQKSKPAKINGSDKKKSITPDLIQMTTKATEKISEKLLPNISKDSFVEKPIPDKNVFKIQKDEPGKIIIESKNELKRSSIDSNSHEKSKVDPISYEEKFENALSFYTPKHRHIENTQNNAAGNKNAFKTGLPDLKTLESEKQDIRKIELDNNRNDKISSVMSFDKNKIKIPDRNSLTSKANGNLNSTSIVNHATEANLKSKDINDEKNKIILPQIEEVGKRDAENSKNTSKGNLIFNQNKINKGKDTTYPYKKSVTVPNIANLLENNYTEVNKQSPSNTEKIKKTEPASLSTGNVPITLQEGKSFAKIADKKTGKDKSETNLYNKSENSVPKLTGGEKMGKENLISTSEIKKEILTDIPLKNNSKEKDNLKNFQCSKTLTNTLSEPAISPDKIPVADKSSSSSVMKEMAKSIPILEEKIQSLTESKISSKTTDKQVLKETDIKIEFKEPRTRLKVEEKTEPHLDNFHNSAENIKDVSAVNINSALDTITKIRENNSVIDIGLDKQNTPEFFKLPSINDDTQPNGLAQKNDKFIEKDSFSMPTHVNSGVNLLSCVEGVMKKDIFQKEKEVSKVNINTNDEKAINKNSMSLSSDKNLLISEKILDSETLSVSKDDITERKECAPVTQKPDLNEVKIANDSQTPKPNKPKVPKLPPVPPPYGRIGLFLRPKDPPQTILESSSSESESETETETETSEDESALAVKKCSNLTNGKSPDRDEKCRSRSETSNASIYSNLSNSTTYTTYSTSSIDDEYDRSPIKPKEKLKQLRFRKYEVDDFVFLKLLGKGSFGKVLLAELKDSEMYFAIKCLKKDVVLEDDDVESTMIERRVLALGTQHPYMCKLYCTFQTKSYLFFVMEYLNGGDLMFHIQESRPFKEDRAMFYAAEIVSALKFLHKRGIVYRDIKLDNVMLDEQGHVRLVDFGMCQCRIYMEECMPSNFCGTPSYIAPEIVLGQKYNQSVDWWSFGILLYEMLSGRSPFHGTDEDELFWSICNEEPHYPRFLSREAINIVGLLLQKSPSKRLGMPTCSAGDIKDHAFFSSINWDKIEKKQVPPPFRPSVSGPSDTSNFDSSFTMDSASLSPVENEVLESMDQQQFHGFSYTNPHITD